MLLGIYGAGGMGRTIYDSMRLVGRCTPDSTVMIDDTMESDSFYGLKRFSYEDFKKSYSPAECELFIAQGEPMYKRILREKVKADGYRLSVFVHPDAQVANTAELGEGCFIDKGACVSSDAKLLGNICMFAYAVIGHDCLVDQDAQISALSNIGGEVKIGRESFVGMSSVIRDKTNIGDYCIISAGATVLKDVPDSVIVMGNPARIIQKNESGKVWN